MLDELGALGMGESFEREFIAQCLRDADGCLRRIGAGRRSAATGTGVREQAHALKGVASNLGLVKLAAASAAR